DRCTLILISGFSACAKAVATASKNIGAKECCVSRYIRSIAAACNAKVIGPSSDASLPLAHIGARLNRPALIPATSVPHRKVLPRRQTARIAIISRPWCPGIFLNPQSAYARSSVIAKPARMSRTSSAPCARSHSELLDEVFGDHAPLEIGVFIHRLHVKNRTVVAKNGARPFAQRHPFVIERHVDARRGRHDQPELLLQLAYARSPPRRLAQIAQPQKTAVVPRAVQADRRECTDHAAVVAGQTFEMNP